MFKVLSGFLVLLLLQLHSTNGQTVTLEPLSPVDEGSTFTACFTISEAPASDTGLVVNVQNNTPDISAVDQDLTFASELTECIDDIEALLDDRIEGIESVPSTFSVEVFEDGVSTGTEDIGFLLINDMTTLSVKFEQSSYVLSEGSQLNTVCVSINGFIDTGSFSVDLEYTGVTAAPLDDYTEGSAEVSFSSTTVDQMECVTVTASDDELVEGLETFTIALASVSSATLVIDTEMNTTTVTILDADSNCGAPPEGDDVGYTISLSATDSDGGLVVNPDAVATYSCTVEGDVIEDVNELTCVIMDGTAQWYPAEAPICEQAPTDEQENTDPTSGATQNTSILTYILCAALVTKCLLHM